MKRYILLLLPLLTLACMSSAALSAAPTAGLPADTPTTHVDPTVTASPVESAVCAKVIAIEAVNVRDQDNHVIGQLKYNDVVTVTNGAGDWWDVVGATVSGRVRSKFLESVKCQ